MLMIMHKCYYRPSLFIDRNFILLIIEINRMIQMDLCYCDKLFNTYNCLVDFTCLGNVFGQYQSPWTRPWR